MSNERKSSSCSSLSSPGPPCRSHLSLLPKCVGRGFKRAEQGIENACRNGLHRCGLGRHPGYGKEARGGRRRKTQRERSVGIWVLGEGMRFRGERANWSVVISGDPGKQGAAHRIPGHCLGGAVARYPGRKRATKLECSSYRTIYLPLC